MSLTSVLIVLGLVGIGLLGVVRNRRQTDLAQWTIAERGFPRWTSWFLQAGEQLTTFSFLGLAGLAFTGGMSATYAIAYLTMSSVGLYFIAPRFRDLGADRGYLTMADFFADRFRSRALGRTVALLGAIFLVPYLQLQITGLGLIVELATGSTRTSSLSMVVASAMVVGFVLWAGIRGIMRVAIFKDVAMLAALVVVLVGVTWHFGGLGNLFREVEAQRPEHLTLHAGAGFDTTFFLTATFITTLGASLNTFPHLWPPILAAESGAVLRSNYKWLALYQFLVFIPIVVGLGAVVVLDPGTAGNHALLTMADRTLPGWLLALVAIGGASAAMAPAAAIAMGISTLVSHNLLDKASPRVRFRANHATVVVAIGAALVFGLRGADIGALLLLTYGGLTQLAPATALALPDRVRVGAVPVLAGAIAGTATVALLTFADLPIGSWDSGFIALGPNLLVLVALELARRSRSRRGARGGRAQSSSSLDRMVS